MYLAGKPFELIDRKEQIIRDIHGILKPNGCRQFNTAYIEISRKPGKFELAAAVAAIMALDRTIRCGNNTGSSVYDDIGILFI